MRIQVGTKQNYTSPLRPSMVTNTKFCTPSYKHLLGTYLELQVEITKIKMADFLTLGSLRTNMSCEEGSTKIWGCSGRSQEELPVPLGGQGGL